MIKRITGVCLIAIMLSACTSLNLGANSKKLELGMSKQQAIALMGKEYSTIRATNTYEGNFETIRYISPTTMIHYILTFRDGQLVEWGTE